MRRTTPYRVTLPCLGGLLLAGSLLTPSGASALQQPFRILLDDDNDTATGCTVPTADGPVDGVDQVLLVTLDIQPAVAQVIGLDRQVCSGGLLVADPIVPAPPVPWNVGLGLGEDGADVVEAYLPRTYLTTGAQVLLGIASGDGGSLVGADALLGLGPIQIREQGFTPEIPTLDEWGLLALALVLAALGLVLLRRRRSVALTLLGVLALGAAAGLAWASSTPDGLIDDWTGIAPLGLDPIGEPLNEDLRAGFARVSATDLCLRFDVFLDTTNGPPVAVDDAYATDEDTVLNVPATGVLGNDSDPDLDVLTVTDNDPTSTQGAPVSVSPNGSFTYDPTAVPALQALDDGESVDDTFGYTVSDGFSTDTATVTVTVNGVNDAPTAMADMFATDEDMALVIAAPGVLINDDDVDVETITAVLDTDVSNGTLVLNADGSFTYTPDLNFNGMDSFTYHATDGDADSPIVTVTITVGPVNDGPMAVDDTFMTDEDTPLSIAAPGVLMNDTDPENDPLTVTTFDVTGTEGAVTVNADGSFTYDPTGSAVLQALDDGESVDDTFTYTIDDGSGNPDTATVTVTVDGVNDAPVALDDTYATDEDVPLNVAAPGVLGNDTDVDVETLTAVLVSGPSNAASFTLNADGSFTYTPALNFNGSDSFTYRANDGTVSSNLATVTITVNPVNDPPVADNEVVSAACNIEDVVETVPGQTAAATGNVFRTITDNVLVGDGDPVEGTAITIVQADGATSDATAPFQVTTTQGGTATLFADGSFVYTPEAGDRSVADSFTYTIQDADGGQAVGTVTLNVGSICVWFVDNAVNPTDGDGDGTSSDPFSSLVDETAPDALPDDAEDASQAGDVVYVFTGNSRTGDPYGGEYTADANERILGQGVDLVVDLGSGPETLFDSDENLTDRPQVDAPLNTTFTVLNVAGVEIAGFDITGDDGPGVGVGSTTAVAGLSLHDNTIDVVSAHAVDIGQSFGGTSVVDVSGNTLEGASNGLRALTSAGSLALAVDDNTNVVGSVAGVELDGSGGGQLYVTSFCGNSVSGDSAGAGIVADTVIFDADPSDADFTGDQVVCTATTTSVGSSGNPVGGPAMMLTGVAGDLAFGTLDLYTDGMGAVGLDVAGTGLLNAGAGTGFAISSTGGTISSADGPAVVLDPLTAGLTFDSVSSASSPTTGVSLTDIAGTFSAAAGSITGAAGTSFDVNGGTPAVTYNGSITHTGNGSRTIEIQSMTGGSATFGAAVSATDGTGIRIANNTGTNTVSFMSTVDLGTGVGTRLTDGDALTMTGNSAATTVSAPDLDVFTNGFQGVVASGSGTLDLDALSLDTTGNGGRALNLSGIHSLVDADLVTCSNNSDCVTLSGLAAASTTTFAAVGLTCTGGTCFNASGAQTVAVTGNGNSISATNAVGLNLTNTTVGAANATFQSISSSGAANGIVVAATGSTGAFQVTGTGTTDASGGTIQMTTGDAVTANNVRGGLNLSNMVLGDATATLGQAKDAIDNVGGDGIDLVGVDDVVLTNMRIARTNNHGIDGTDVTNFAISDSEIFNAGDDNGDSGISFEGVGNDNLDGIATVTNTVIDGAVEFGMRVQNSSGTLALTVSGSQFSNTANTASLMFGEDGLQIEVLGSAQTTALITGSSTFSMLESDGIMATTSENGAAVLNITIDGNIFTGFDNGAPNMRSDNAIELNATGGTNAANSPDLRYTINGNTINSSSNSAILIGANDFTNVDGRITNNVINGSLFGFGIEAPLSADDNSVARLLVTGNTISNQNQQGAFFNANNSGDLDITFNGNTVSTRPSDSTAFENALFQVTSGSLCVAAAGNTVALGGADAFGPGVSADAMAVIGAGGTAQLEVGSANLADPAATVLSTNNPAAASVFAGGTISVVANGTCATPIATPLP